MNRVLVVGDAIVDCYYTIEGVKNNSESDGLVYKIVETEHRLGGAAAVAMICNSLELKVDLFALGGNDLMGQYMYKMLCDLNIYGFNKAPYYRTIHKIRYVHKNDRKLYSDRFDFDYSLKPSKNELDIFESVLKNNTNIIISDYGKGACSLDLLRMINPRDRLILVDPAYYRPWKEYTCLNETSIIKANLKEAKAELDITENKYISLTTLVKRLNEKHNKSIVVTAGEKGMAYYDNTKKKCGQAYSDVIEVVDVCGAGDTVASAIMYALLDGSDLEGACVFANRCAEVQVQQLGVEGIKIIRPEKLENDTQITESEQVSRSS